MNLPSEAVADYLPLKSLENAELIDSLKTIAPNMSDCLNEATKGL